jgi:hypothetical protein
MRLARQRDSPRIRESSVVLNWAQNSTWLHFAVFTSADDKVVLEAESELQLTQFFEGRESFRSSRTLILAHAGTIPWSGQDSIVAGSEPDVRVALAGVLNQHSCI